MANKYRTTVCWGGCNQIQRIGYKCPCCGIMIDMPIAEHRKQHDDKDSKIANHYNECKSKEDDFGST